MLRCQFYRVPAAQGKQGKWPKKIPVRENTGNLEMVAKTQGKHREFGFLKFVNPLVLKIKNILIFAMKISKKKLKLNESAKSVLCM